MINPLQTQHAGSASDVHSGHRGLARRLVLWLVLFSVLITTLIIAIDLYLHYRDDIAVLQRNLDYITESQRPALEGAVWGLDEDQIDTQLDAMIRLPDMEYLAIIVDGTIRWQRGTLSSQRTIERTVALTHQSGATDAVIGQMRVVASVDQVVARRLSELSRNALDTGLRTLLIAAFTFFLFNALVARHLQKLARFLAALSPTSLPERPVEFDRAHTGAWRPDELDAIRDAINGMIESLRQSQNETALTTRRLKEREAFLDAVIGSAGRAIVVIDRDTLAVLDANATACRLLGYTREEYLGLRLPTYQVDVSEAHLCELLHALEEVGGGTFVTRYRRKDGATIDVDLDTRLVNLGTRHLIVDLWADITRQKEVERELATTRDDLRLITESAAEAMWTVLDDGTIAYANPAACRLSGHTIEQLRDTRVVQLLNAESIQRVREQLPLLENFDHVLRQEWTVMHSNGTPISVEATIQRLPDGRYLVIGRDISERRQAEIGLRRAAGVFTSSVEGIMITDAANRILDVNPAFTSITGYARDEAIGRNPAFLSSGRHAPAFFSEMRQVLHESGHWRGEIWNRKKDGTIFVELLSISLIRDTEGNPAEHVAVFSDISRLKAHEEELDRIAHYDALTGLPNRRLLDDRLRLARARAEREGKLLAVGFLDLDGFKPINDDLGHAAGDEFLKVIAQRLEATLRGGDTLARLGGDEFVLLLDDLGAAEECLPVLNRVLHLVAQPVNLFGREMSVSASIGVTLYPLDNSDSDTLLRHADQAMYQAKQQGKNRAHMFDAENDRRIVAHREALQELKEALEKGELALFYQPKIDLRNGEVVGAEALIRWIKSDGKVIAPGQFLPIIDGSPLELDVSAWVIETALSQVVNWKQTGLPCQISANLVAAHLQSPDFLGWLERLLGTFPSVGQGEFSLEILESAAIGDIDAVARRLDAVRKLGVGLSLDDFGTGYSSLAYLRRLPVDTIKVDQTFVRDMLQDHEAYGIVDSVIRLGDVFSRRAVAEGIETIDHWRALLNLRCGYGQGYGIARPMPASAFPAWVAQWRAEQRWRDLERKD